MHFYSYIYYSHSINKLIWRIIIIGIKTASIMDKGFSPHDAKLLEQIVASLVEIKGLVN